MTATGSQLVMCWDERLDAISNMFKGVKIQEMRLPVCIYVCVGDGDQQMAHEKGQDNGH